MSKKKILLIDDEEDFSTLLKLNIDKATEYEVLVANSGEAGLELVKKHRPDLVLLDIMMPGMDGMETLEKIKATTPDLPVAMVTAVYKEEEAKRCFDAGASDYITKPVDFEHLKTALLVKLFLGYNPGAVDPTEYPPHRRYPQRHPPCPSLRSSNYQASTPLVECTAPLVVERLAVTS